MKAIVIGSRETLQYIDVPPPIPGPDQVLVQVSAAGINFMDIGVRQGSLWKDTPLPRRLGVEGAGRVLKIGNNVNGISAGQRVAWAYSPGSYAEQVAVSASALVPIPEGIDEKTAASVMMQGLTASHFTTDFYPIQSGDIALVHAAAGGLGLLLTQMIKLKGGHVIGRVSSADKVVTAKEAGADHVIIDTSGNFAEEVVRLANREGVNVVYDGSGPSTFQGSVDSLRVAGTLCWYGPVLGGPGLLDIASLPKSIKIGYASFMHHVRTPELLRFHTNQLFELILNGKLKVRIGREYPLANAADAHLEMENRRTTGKLLLIP